MPPTIHALETTYRGVRYRSRLEARWAVYFDTLGIRHEYEPQGYQTSYGRYLPDFWLASFGAYAEVKRDQSAFDRLALGKCSEVGHGTRRPFLLLAGPPSERLVLALVPHGQETGFGSWVDLAMSVHEERLYWQETYGETLVPRIAGPAVAAALSARFGT